MRLPAIRVARLACHGKKASTHFVLSSPLVTWALRRPVSRFPEAFSRAAALIWMRFTTCFAPAVFAMRVAAPLCCTTPVDPSQYAVPPCTRTVNPSLPIFDLANLARIAAFVSRSCWEDAAVELVVLPGADCGAFTGGAAGPSANARQAARKSVITFI